MVSVFLLLLLHHPPSPLFSQTTSGLGRSTITGPVDPNRPFPTVPLPPPRVLRGHPSLPPEQYAAYKQSLARRPGRVGPPGLEVFYRDANSLQAPFETSQPFSLAPTTSFEGISQTALSPPDPDIAAGPQDLILVVNAAIARYSKTGLQTNFVTLQQWFSNVLTTACPDGTGQCTIVDPTIRYDSLHGRFLLLAFSTNGRDERTHFLLSVSNDATFSGGWRNWALPGHLNGNVETPYEVDYPQMGYDSEAVYLTANMFGFTSLGSLAIVYNKLRILKKSELYSPNTTALTWRDIIDFRNADGTVAQSLRPAEVHGPAALHGGARSVLLNAATLSPNRIDSANFLTLWRIENPTSANPQAIRTHLPNVWRYDFPAPVRQKDVFTSVDTGDARVLRAIIRNGALYAARNSGYVDEPVTVTYDRIDLARNRLTLQARHTNGGFFFPAFHIPASHGPANAFPNKLIAGTNVDANGALTYLSFSDVKAGEDPFLLSSFGTVRWGDYAGAAIDPIDGGLWVLGEYAKVRAALAGRWGTWAAYFPWQTNAQFTDVSTGNPFFSFINVLKLWSITGGCDAARYCPAAPVTRGQMAVFVIRAMLGDTYSFPQQPYFTDVPATHPFFPHIQKLRELGITAGCSSSAYCPDQNVTRGETAVFLIRGKLRSLFGDQFPHANTPAFTDVPATQSQFPFIQKMRELGITTGCTATTYCPSAPVTREQMAAFLVRAFVN